MGLREEKNEKNNYFGKWKKKKIGANEKSRAQTGQEAPPTPTRMF